MRRRLRALWTLIVSADAPCVKCGRPSYWAGALRTDVCEQHYWERLG